MNSFLWGWWKGSRRRVPTCFGLRLEPLEGRTVPAVVFANRGQPSDTFMPAEHALIDRAIQLWEQRITIPQTLNIEFTGGSTSGLHLSGAVGYTVTEYTDLPNFGTFPSPPPARARIEIASDAVGQPWFIDPTPQDNAEFIPIPGNPFSFESGPGPDMLSTIAHELGHALGLPPLSRDALVPDGDKLLFIGSDGFQARFESDGGHLDPDTYDRDLMLAVQQMGTRDIPSDTDVHILIDCYSSYQLAGASNIPPATPVPPPALSGTVVPFTAGTYDPTTATWYLRSTGEGGTTLTPFSYGAPGWVPLSGDWDGDGQTSVGMFDPSTATFYLRNGNSAGAPDAGTFTFGAPGWVPLSGDWDGDGQTSVGVFDPATATFYLRNSNNAGAPDAGLATFGLAGWKPVTGDWDNDNRTSIGVFDPATATWYLRNENAPGAPDAGQFVYGLGSWTPVTGRWNGTGPTAVGMVDPAVGGWYLRTSNGPGAPDFVPFDFGLPGWQPLSGDWNAFANPTNARSPVDSTLSELLNALLSALPHESPVSEWAALDWVFGGGLI